MIEQTYKLSMIPFEEQVRRNYEIPIVPASQYDKTLRTLSFELYNGEDRFTIPAEAVVYIFGMKPDGNAFQYQMTVEENVAKIAMQTQMTTVAGCVTCEIAIFEENTSGPRTGSRIGSANFKLMVEKCAVGDDADFSRSDMPVIQTLIYGGTVGDVLVKDANGVKWNSESLSTGYMRYDQYDPDRTGTVDSARDSKTVDGHTVARNVLADEYTNTEIDGKVQAVQDDVDALNSSAVKSVNTITPVDGNVTLSKSDVGLGNVDNTSDADKPISTATQAALDQKVDKVAGKGLSTNDFTDQWRNKLEGIEEGADVNVQANWDQTVTTADDYIQNKPSIPEKTSELVNDSGFITAALAPVQGVKGSAESAYRTGSVSISKENIGLGNVDNTSDADKPISTAVQTALDQKVDKETGKGLSTNDFTSAEKTKLAGIEAGAQVNTITGVKGDAEAEYRTGNVNITKANIGLGNVDNTSDMDKPISTATQTALDSKQATLTFDTTPTAGSTNPVTSDGIASVVSELNSNLNTKVSSVNEVLPDANGNVQIDATKIDTSSGVAIKSVSGNPVTIADALQGKALGVTATLEPIQNLHGYDKPWAGGAGKNKLPYPYVLSEKTVNGVTFTANEDGTILVNGTASANADYYLYEENGLTLPVGTYVLTCDNIPTGSYIVFGDGGGTPYKNVFNTLMPYSFSVTENSAIKYGIVRITSGSTVNDVVIKPMIRLASETDATFEPYSNICPITGRTQVDVTRTGKNLLNITGVVPTFPSSAQQTLNADGTITLSGTTTSTTNGSACRFDDGQDTMQLPNGRYRFVDSNPNGETNWYYYLRVTGNATWYRSGNTFNITDEQNTVWICLYTRSNFTISGNHGLMVIKESETDDYEPYTGQSVTVQLGQTVYGGTLNVTTGELTVETANIASYNGESIGEPWWSSMDEYVAGTLPTTGAQVVYTLATPTTVSLTPAQIQLLTTTNIISTSADDLSVRYYATGQTGNVERNLSFLLDKTASNETAVNTVSESIAPTETGTATQNYAVGDYLMLNNRLCKVTVAIATGEQIIVGSNVQYTTVAEELTAILAQINA